MHRLLAFICFYLFTNLCVFPQGDIPLTNIRYVKVIDEVRYILLDKVKFNIYDNNGKLIKDPWISRLTSTSNGKERFEGYSIVFFPGIDTLTIEAEVDGYTIVDTTLTSPSQKYVYSKGNSYVWNDEIILKTTLEPYKELDELAVNATRILMVQKGDTIIYNAAALQLSAGSMLNDLVRALPGAQLESGGRITINGEKVTNLLVNGKDFFKGDPLVALTNLPYYTVDKIKVYHRGPELKNATRADSIQAETVERPLVMDVRLKKEYGQGWLANAEVAGGMRTIGELSSVYRGRAFALRFTDHSKLAIYATANNVGDSYKASHSGEWREMKASSFGEPIVQQGGVDFSIENKDASTKFSTVLEAQHSTNEVLGNTNSQQFFNTGDIFSRSQSQNNTNSVSIDWNATFSRDIKKYNISVTPRISFRKRNDNYNIFNVTSDRDTWVIDSTSSLDSLFSASSLQNIRHDIITASKTLSASNNQTLSTGISASGGILLPFTNEKLNIGAGISYSQSKSVDIRFLGVAGRNITSYNDNSRTLRPGYRLNYDARVSHSLFRFNNKNFGNVSSNLTYSYSHNSSNTDYQLRRSGDPMADEIRDMTVGELWPLDLVNSYEKDESSDSHYMLMQLYYYLSRFTLRSSVSCTHERRELIDARAIANQHLVDKRWRLQPSILFSCGQLFSMSYSMSPHLPSLLDLQDITDSSNSLYIFKGNPNLKNTYTHAFDIGIKTNRKSISQWLNYNLSANIMQHEIKRVTTYDRITGVTTYQPRNIDGNWWASGGVSFGRALDRDKRWNMSLDSKYTFAHSVDYINDAVQQDPQTSLVLNHRLSEHFKLSYGKNKFRVELNGKVLWTVANSDRANFQRQSYIDQSYGVTLMTPLFWGIDLDTDLMVYLRSGYHDPSMNTTEWQWNASLSTRLGKKKLWTARLVGFDLLHQLSNITRTLDSQGRVETWHNTIRSYVTLNLTYHFEMKPKKGIE